MSLDLVLAHDAPTDQGDTIPRGSTVGYLGHVPGGMIRVRWGPVVRVIHPETTRELSSKSLRRTGRWILGILVVSVIAAVGTSRPKTESDQDREEYRKAKEELTHRVSERIHR